MLHGDRTMLRLEIDVDALRLQIVQVLDARHMELRALVESEVERTKLTLETTLREAIRKGIDQTIRQAVEAQMWRLRQAIEPGIGKAIAEMLTKIGAEPG